MMSFEGAAGGQSLEEDSSPSAHPARKIRNDGGFWQQLEEYISEHSEAEFSHGICQPLQ